MHFIKFISNKPLPIPRLIATLSAATNQAGSLSIGPNNTNTGGKDGKNAIAINSIIKNK